METVIVGVLSSLSGVLLGWHLGRKHKKYASIVATHEADIADVKECITVIDEFLKTKSKREHEAMKSLASEVRQSLGITTPDPEPEDDAVRPNLKTEAL
jgi:hypothetical protein